MYLGFDSRWPCLKYLQYLNFYAAIAGMVSLGGSLIFQLNLFEGSRNVEISAAVDALASQGDVETRGAIFTREEVVDFILDLVGYNDDQNLFYEAYSRTFIRRGRLYFSYHGKAFSFLA